MDTIQLLRAVEKNNSEKVEMLLKNGADVNAKGDMGMPCCQRRDACMKS